MLEPHGVYTYLLDYYELGHLLFPRDEACDSPALIAKLPESKIILKTVIYRSDVEFASWHSTDEHKIWMPNFEGVFFEHAGTRFNPAYCRKWNGGFSPGD